MTIMVLILPKAARRELMPFQAIGDEDSMSAKGDEVRSTQKHDERPLEPDVLHVMGSSGATHGTNMHVGLHTCMRCKSWEGSNRSPTGAIRRDPIPPGTGNGRDAGPSPPAHRETMDMAMVA